MSDKQTDQQPSEEILVSQPIPFYKAFRQTVPPIYDWHQWLKLARKTTTIDEKIGLLHVAFNVGFNQESWNSDAQEYKPLYTHIDRLDFLFGLADGWDDSSLLETEGVSGEKESEYFIKYDELGNRIKRTESEQRQVLAHKSFDILVAKFFRMPSVMREKNPHTRSEKEADWIERFVFGKSFPIVQNFFKVEETAFGDMGIRNLPHHFGNEKPSQQEKHITAFLLKLARFLWSWKKAPVNSWETEEGMSEAEKEKLIKLNIVDGAKPWMIEVLLKLGELNVLEEWILDLDEASLATLEKIALRNSFSENTNPVIEDRGVITIDEACYLGSKAALLIKRHEIAVRENNRLKAILKAQQTREQADRHIDKLTREK